jgi:hypothetical protein
MRSATRLTHVVLWLCCATGSSYAAAPNLYEWVAPSPLVAAAEIRNDRGKYTDFELTDVLRGAVPRGTRLMVDVKRANRDRDEGRAALRLEPDRQYLLLLQRDDRHSTAELMVYAIVRGIDGVRELPAEGAPALLDAVRRFVAVQDRKDEIAAWKSFREMLEETNPVLLETALDLFVKFRRGDLTLLPVLRPILEHPRPDIRVRTARLVGQIVEHRAEGEIPDDVGILAELYGRARRDDAVEVRVAATSALGGIAGQGPEEILREIARSDPEQAVRFEAKKLLYERNAAPRPEHPGEKPGTPEIKE